jgi:hypothetical protein
VCLGHFWLLKFGKVPGINRCVEKEFKLVTCKCEEYKGLRYRDGEDTVASEAPVALIVNSSEL